MTLKRGMYVTKRWIKRHYPRFKTNVTLKVQVIMPEVNEKQGQGWITLTKEQVLKAAGLHGSYFVEGVRWNAQDETLKIALKSKEIPAVGGYIIQTDPIVTEKQLRDGANAKRLSEATLA